MVTEEKELRKVANNLILVLGMSEQFRQGLDSFDALLSMSDYEQRIFENPAAMSPFSAAKEHLKSSFEEFKKTYGSSVISNAYEAFKSALSTETFCADAGIENELTKSETATLFNKVFEQLSGSVGELPEEADGYAVFLEAVRSSFAPADTETANGDICPYCGGTPTKISRAEFFGTGVDDNNGCVWACECGAYADISTDGAIIGTMADRELHAKRKAIKGILFETVRTVGVTVFEACSWISRLTGRRIRNVQDIEFLNAENCHAIEQEFEKLKERLKNLKVQYPSNHKELMEFFEEGGRLAAVNAYGYKTGRLFVPIDVGKEAVRVRFKKTVQDIMFPSELDYRFSGALLSITHPTGKCEKFRLYTKAQRMILLG